MIVEIVLILLCVLCLWLHQKTLPYIPGFEISNEKGKLQTINFDGRAASNKYGKVYKMWNYNEPVVVIADYDIAKIYYKDHLQHPRDADFCLGPVIEAMLSNAIGTKYGNEWSHHRKCLKFMINNDFLEYWKPEINILCFDYINNIIKNREINIQSTINRFTISILSKIMYGTLPPHDYDHLMHLADIHDTLMSKANNIDNETKVLVAYYKFEWREFNIKLMQNPQPHTGLKNMMDSKLSTDEILGNLDEILLFNIDVMYSALGALLVNLSRHPDIQEQIYEELKNNNLETHLISDFINESARHNPSLYLSFPERAATNMYLGGYFVPKGTIVLIDADSINNRFKNANYFEIDRSENRNSRSFHRFGLGPRTCLGQKFAQLILQQCLIHVVNRCILYDPHKLTGTKSEGLCFFTPYLKFPTIRISYRSTVICGLSLGNSFYNEKNIERIFDQWSNMTPQLITFIPDEPSFHTYMAKINKPMSEQELIIKTHEIKKKCRNYSSRIHRFAINAAKNKNFHFVDINWVDMTAKNREIYDESLSIMVELYHENDKFRNAVNNVTLEVVTDDGDLQEGSKFLLKELAFIVKAPEILGVDSIIYSYHRDFPIVDNVLSGSLGYKRVNNVFTMTIT